MNVPFGSHHLHHPHRIRHALAVTGAVAGWVFAFAIALVVAVLLHLDLPAARHFAEQTLNQALASQFKGRIEITGLDDLGLHGVRGVDARIIAPDGTNVIVAHGVRARINPVALVRTFIARKGDIGIGVFDVDVDDANVSLDTDKEGNLKIATAFEPANPSPPTEDKPGARQMRIDFPNIQIRHAWVHGNIPGAPIIDADVDHVKAAVHVAQDVTIDVSHLELASRGMPNGANAKGAVVAHIAVPSARGNGVGLLADYQGAIGAIPLHANAHLDGDFLRAVVDANDVSPEKIHGMVADAPVYQPVSLHAEAVGPLNALDARARASIGPGAVDAAAHLSLSGDFAAHAHAEADRIDVRAFSRTAPKSSLGATVDVSVRALPNGVIHGTYEASVQPGAIAGQTVPSARLAGAFENAPATATDPGGFTVDTSGRIDETGAPIDVKGSMHPSAAGNVVAFDVHTNIPKLAAITRVGGLGPGRADVAVKGSLLLATVPTFDATARVAADGLAQPGVSIATAIVDAHASGTFDAPAIEASIDASDVKASDYSWSRVKARLNGSLAAEDVTIDATGQDAPSITGRARVGVGASTTITGADFTVRRDRSVLHAEVAKVHIGNDGIEVDDATISGAGEPLHATLAMRGRSLAVRADSAGIDLPIVAHLVKLDDHLRSGRATLAVDLTVHPDGAEGEAKVTLAHAQWDQWKEIGFSLDATTVGRKATATATATMQGVGEVGITRSVIEIGGNGPLDTNSWRHAFGKVHLDGQVDLARVAALLPPNTLPVADVGGKLVMTAHASRSSATDVQPDLKVSLATTGLHVSARSDVPDKHTRTTIVTEPAWQVNGIDASIDANANGTTGFAELSARLLDHVGPLVAIDVKSGAVPYAALMDAQTDRVARLMDLPISARISMPARDLAALPAFMRPEAATGVAKLDLDMQGTARAPKIALDASAYGVRMATGPSGLPLDAIVRGKYDGSIADVSLDVSSPKESFVHAIAHANAKSRDLLSGDPNAPWDGSAHATLIHFPLGAVSPLSDRDIRGRVSGEVDVTDLHKDARVKAALVFDRLAVGRARFTIAKVDAAYDGKSFDARAHVEQKDGVADATAKIGMKWGSALAPAPDANSPMNAELHAKHFRAAFIEPFLSSAVDEIDGLIDADAKMALAPGKKPEMSGNVLFHDGRVDMAAIGEELHGVNAKLSLTEDGTVKLEDVVALGTTGKLTAGGEAHLDGTALKDATARLDIAKKDALPLAVGGANMGHVYGHVDLTAKTTAATNATDVVINVPNFHVELPEASPHSVQDLDPTPAEVHVGTYSEPPGIGAPPRRDHFVVLLPSGDDAKNKTANDKPAKLSIAVHLGTIEIRRGTEIGAVVTGTPVVKIAAKTTMTGQIVIKSGKLDVQGKPFEIQKGTATFVGDPSNPEVNVTASWKAEDGTEVYADYIGPLKTGKVVLHSEPPRPENEIVALILFGTADGSQATPYNQPPQDTATKAGSAVGGFAAGGLNKGIDKLTGMDIQTKVDTSQANPRPEVEVRIARDISLQIAFVLGTPPPGTNPDTTYATIDWRFVRNWSLATTFGNLGSSMADVVWRYRY